MLKKITLFLILISFFCCKEKNENKSKSEKINTIAIKNFTNTLIPIEIVKPKNKNIYKKYGLEFIGNCYACDLVYFVVENNRIYLYNVCDNGYEKENRLSFEIINFINTSNMIKIKTKDFTFDFTKVEVEPVYKLKTNYKTDNKTLRISEYYTFEKYLTKFEVHDCGDFDG